MQNYELNEKHIKSNNSYIKNIIKLIRIKHYVKNALIFVPLIFSLNFTKTSLIFNELLAFFAFSLTASFVYVINDIADKEKDRQHPTKKNRPIAAGSISISQGLVIAAILILLSFYIAYSINLKSLLIVAIYLITNLLYSFWLKHIPIVDVSIIALGFILRVLIGGAAIDVPISKWLLLTIMTLSFYLGFAKRRNEMSRISQTNETRKVLKEYNLGFMIRL
jgi:4-hydroxybenzoate polyprenyltransferase